MNIYELINNAREKQGLTWEQAMIKCGLAVSTTTNIKNQKHLSSATLEKLAVGLNIPEINPNQMQQSEDEINLINSYRSLSPDSKRALLNSAIALHKLEASGELTSPTVEIKHSVLKVSAGVGEWLSDTDDWEELTIDDTPLARKADFALTISGDSMQPNFDDGDIVLVRSQPAVNIGDICIYTLGNEGYIKQFQGDRLVSLNPEYNDINLADYSADEIRCVGLVLGKI